MARSISEKMRADRLPAALAAAVLALPSVAIVLGALWLFVRSLEHREESADLVLSGILLLLALMFWLIAGWTYSAVRSALTPQRVQAMWLRRFQSEKRDDFRPSRVIDRLSRYGISAITLQDRDVKLSFEQRRNRLAPVFWLFFAPIALLLAWAGFSSFEGVQESFANQELPAAANIGEALVGAFAQAIVQVLVLAFVIIVFALAIVGAAVLFFLVAALAGPFGAMFSGKRDDFRRLPRLLERLKRGKGRRGAAIVRVSDANWQQAVTSALSAVDVAIIDISDVTDNVAWEISEAVKACGASSLVFICKDGVRLSDQARAIVRQALGREPAQVVTYPARKSAGAKRFAQGLREQICAAADLRLARA